MAALISNCQDKNGRLEYAKKLGEHIEVDIYGYCGNLKCPRPKEAVDAGVDCLNALRSQYRCLSISLMRVLFFILHEKFGVGRVRFVRHCAA